MDTSMALQLPCPDPGLEPEPTQNVFRVVHPLDDEPEAKFDPDGLGPMHISASVRTSLLVLRLYLVTMVILVAYRVVELAAMNRC